MGSVYAVLFFFFFFWVNKTFYSSHLLIYRFTSPSTIIKTQNPSSPSMYSSPLLQLKLWNFKRISRYQWCMPLGISVSYIGRGSPSILIVLFFILPKVWLLISFIWICFPLFSWISKLKHPQKNKKLNIREMYINLKGGKIIFPNREKDRWKRKKIYLRVLRLRSWFVSMRSLNPWWTVRQSRECGDKVAAATARVWIVDSMSVSEGLRLEIWD